MKIKTTLWIVLVVFILALIPTAVLFYQNKKLQDQVSLYAGELNISHEQLTKSLQRAETKIAKSNEELVTFAKSNEIDIETIERDLSSIDGRLEAVAVTKAKTTTVVHNHYPSDSVTPAEVEVPICKSDGRPIDVHGYTKRVETKALTNSTGMEVAKVSFSAARERPWSSKVYGIQYKILNTVGRGAGGQTILATELIAENSEVQPGEIFRIEGVESRVLQAPEPGPEFDWWDPSLYLIAQPALVVYNEVEFSVSISLGFSVWSYGSNWRFLGITAGYDAFQNAFRASFFPVLYNVGGPLPFLSDIWIGMDLSVDSRSSIGIGLIIGTRL